MSNLITSSQLHLVVTLMPALTLPFSKWRHCARNDHFYRLARLLGNSLDSQPMCCAC